MSLNHEDTKTPSKYKAYPEYKDSGVGWLGKVPNYWERTTFKHLLEMMVDNRGRTPPIYDSGTPLLEAKHIDGSLKYASSSFDKFIDTNGHLSFIRDDVKENDILFITVGTIGKTCLVPKSPEFVIAQNIVGLRTTEHCNPLYLLFWLRSIVARESMLATNKDSILDSIKISDFVQSRLYIPPFEEQKQIAAFLDRETAKIDTLIEKQQQLITLLKEKRQAVISHAVTKGLNPNAPMRDSGIPWLGDVPKHWVERPLKFMAQIKNGRDYKHVEVNEGEGYPVIGSGGEFTRASDFLFNGSSVLLGRKGTIDKPLYIEGAFWTVDTMYYTDIAKNTLPKYLYYCALTIPFDFYSTNTALPSMTQGDLGNHLLLYPPFEEQREIVCFIEERTAQIDKLVSKAEQAIELIKERRTALISAAVTGKIDVRDWKEKAVSLLESSSV